MATVHDVINEQDDFTAHTLGITLWPKQWKAYANPWRTFLDGGET